LDLSSLLQTLVAGANIRVLTWNKMFIFLKNKKKNKENVCLEMHVLGNTVIMPAATILIF
jgi:hypothetical protein